MCLLAVVSARPVLGARGTDDHAHHDPFEPTVSREESKLLNQAIALSATDIHGAIDLLRIKKLEEASPALDFAIGNFYFQQNKLEQAAAAYRAALVKQEKFRSAVMNLGRVYLMQEKTSDAIELYQHLVADGQADADILLLLGHALLMENYPVSAEIAYQQSLLQRPKHPDAMLGMAKSLMQQQRYAQGLALITEILQQTPTLHELWSLKSNAYLAMGKNEDATRVIENARRLGCADADMLATLGDLYLNQNKPADALAAYGLAFKTNTPSPNRMLRACEGFLMVSDLAGAEKMIQRIDVVLDGAAQSFKDRDRIKLLRLKGELAAQQGDAEKAMGLYEELLKVDPLDARTLLLLARGQWEKRDLEQAALTCERAARIQGHESDALILHAQIEVDRARYGRAVELLEASLTFRDQANVKQYLEQVRRMAQSSGN